MGRREDCCKVGGGGPNLVSPFLNGAGTAEGKMRRPSLVLCSTGETRNFLKGKDWEIELGR